MKILYLPLDERPCNYDYPQALARLQPDGELVVPPRELLSAKKRPADQPQLWAWLEASLTDCRVAILSLDMLVYGGLLPSRLHQEEQNTLLSRLERLAALQATLPNLTIFASNLIARTPAYDSSEEEPDYYADWGAAIFRWGWLQDRQQRQGLDESERREFAQLTERLPSDVLDDYRQRRQRNLAVNQRAIALVAAGAIDFLAIPQDDCAPYGFTARDQQQIVRAIAQQRLQHRIHLYPGADEVGCTLLARAYSQDQHYHPRIYPFYSADAGAAIVPLYEDRPLGTSLQAHILAAGGRLAATPDAADFLLAVNTPGQVMQEAWDNPVKDRSYDTQRSLRAFVDRIAGAIAAEQPVAIADVAFANGGETELVEMLDEAQLWDRVLAYAGWNTCGNTLGTAIAAGILGCHSLEEDVIATNTIARLLEDWGYQTVVRQSLQHDYLPSLGASYYDFQGCEAEIRTEIARRLRELWSATLRHSFSDHPWSLAVTAPWQRLFEIGLRLNFTDGKRDR